MTFISTRLLTVAGLRWTGASVIITVLVVAIPIYFQNRSQSTPEKQRGYTVILENAAGDPLPDTVIELIGEGGPYSCTTDNDGVCTIEHVAILPSLSVRVLSGGKKKYEVNVPTANPILRIRLPRNRESRNVENNEEALVPESRHPGRAQAVKSTPALTPVAPQRLPAHRGPAPAASGLNAVTSTPITVVDLPPAPELITPPLIKPATIPGLPEGTISGVLEPSGGTSSLLYQNFRRALRVYRENQQIPDDARRLIDTVTAECLRNPPYLLEDDRDRADAVLRCMDPASFSSCGAGPAIIVSLYTQAPELGSRPHPLVSRDLLRETAPTGFVLNIADAAAKVCKRLNERASSILAALGASSPRVAGR